MELFRARVGALPRSTVTRAAVAPVQGRVLLGALAATVAVFATLWVLLPPRYLTNDDVTIRLGIEGGLVPGQPPVGYVLNSHSALGWALVALHRLLPTAPVWDVVVVGVMVWALATLFALCWPAFGPGWLARSAALAAVFAAAIPFAAGVQFTMSATVAGAASALVLLTELWSAVRPRLHVGVMAAVLLVAALLIRPLAAVAGAGAAVAFFVPLSIAEPVGRRWRLMSLVYVGLAVVVSFAVLQYVDSLAYALDSRWDAYRRTNWLIARATEWNLEAQPSDTGVRSSVGWTTNDWNLLTTGWGVDPDLHGAARVERAYALPAGASAWTNWARLAAGKASEFSAGRLGALLAQSWPLLAVIAVLTCARGRRRGIQAAAGAALLFLIYCVALEISFKELPLRLIVPLQLCLTVAAVLTIGAFQRRSSPVFLVCALGVVIAVAIHQAESVLDQLLADVGRSEQLEEEVLEVAALRPSLLVLHLDAFPSEFWWRPFRRPILELETIRLGANNQNPQLQQFLAESGRQPLVGAICRDDSIVVIAYADRLVPATTYMQEHHDTAVDWAPVHAGTFHAWRCTPRGSITSSAATPRGPSAPARRSTQGPI